ncbi:hypothetical protein AB5I41_04565 [Sphingomonas sp. MMS24-JH45]
MMTTDNAATFTTADQLELCAIGDAIFAEWYPHHRPGDPMPAAIPLRLAREAQELAAKHERCRRLGIGIYAREAVRRL